MGVGFDEIRADADKFAATLKELDDTKVRQTADGLDDMGNKLKGADEQATNAKGALANMVGNSAQDISGLSGSLGVAIGQMAEYSADAILAGTNSKQAFKEMALVAGPIAALAGLQMGISAVKGAADDWKKSQEAFIQQQRDFNKAVEDTGSQFDAISDMIEGNVLLQAAPEMSATQSLINDLPILGRMLDDTAESTMTVAEAMAAAGITQEEWFDAMRVDQAGGLGKYTAMIDQLHALNDAGTITDDTMELLTDQFVRQGAVVANNAAQTQLAATTTGRSLEDINRALDEQDLTLLRHKLLWREVTADMTDGIQGIQTSGVAYEQLQRELHLTNEEMDALVAQKTAEKLEADAAAAEVAAEQLGEYRDAILASRNAAREYARATTSLEWGRAGIAGATTAYEEYRQLVTGDRQRVADSEEAWDGLGGAIEASGEHLMDLQSPEGRAVFDALDELGTSIVPDLAKAFDDSDGDINTFRRSVDTLSTQTLTRLQTEFGVGEDQARDMIAELGLMPEQVETFYKLAGDAEAKNQLELLQGYIDGLPEDVQTTITQKILLGDYQGAVATVQTYANNHPINSELVLDTYAARQALAALRRTANSIGSVFDFGGMSMMAPAPAGYAAPAPATRGRVGVGATAATVAPVNVHIHTAVVGDRYDVQRVVGRAAAAAVRLGGRRGGQ